MDYVLLAHKAQQYIGQYFDKQIPEQLPYHNKAHTENVVAAATQIGNHYQLNEIDLFVVTIGAWFHDMGYYLGDATRHEQNGANMAVAFLKDNGVDESIIEDVTRCILSTQMPQNPETLPEQILCDADLYHLGTDRFERLNKAMRKEAEERKGSDISKKEWRTSTIAFLQAHHYHTEYCQVLLNPVKQQHLDKLMGKQKEHVPATPGAPAISPLTAAPLDKEDQKSKKAERPVRGIETMFRVASTNHQRLSDMADSKAHIMISVNSIILSIVIGLMARKLETSQNLIVPTLILLTGSVMAVIFSVLATRPKIPGGSFTAEELSNRSVNLLFFGNFYKMDYDHYYEGMQEVMKDAEFLYGSLIRDIHSQGIVLGHKYRLLRVSYTIFMFTLILAVLAFAISLLFFD